MAKSKYPGNFDTSVELPTTRDSINSEPINSLRSAIIQIERTLGINPQGSVGNTVSSRLEKSLDSSGNLLPSALALAGVISGPITNNEVSQVAAIHESKLSLDFPTQLLQDEISMIQADLNSVSSLLTEVSTKFAYHTNSSALNRHPATAISTATSSKINSDEASTSLSSSNVQAVLNDLYNKHINYSGADISSDNSSHLAKQIYFDNSNSLINANDVQTAIELTSELLQQDSNDHQNYQHSNGRLRLGALRSPSDIRISQILISDVAASFSSSDGNSSGTTTLTLLDTVTVVNYTINPFDIVIIEDPLDTDGNYVGSYEIKSANIVSGNLISLEIYGLLKGSSTSSTSIIIGKNTDEVVNQAGLLVSVIEEPSLTSARLLQISNPNSNCAISKNIKPSEITSTNRYFILKADSDTYTIDAYNSLISRQTVDSIVSKINEQILENNIPVLAYRLDYETGGSEISIAHNLPDSESDFHQIVISRSTDDGIDSLGFGHIEDLESATLYGTKYFINGQSYSDLKIKLDSSGLIFFTGSNLINTNNTSIDFLTLGIRIGDIVTITGAANNLDNGSYYIDAVTSTDLTVNIQQKPSGFIEDSGSGIRIRIVANSLSVKDLTFDSVGNTFGAALLDIFMDKNREIYYNKLLEYEAVISGTTSLIDIVDIEGKDIESLTLNVTAEADPADINAFLLSSNNSETFSINGQDKYIWLVDSNYNIRMKLYIPDAQAVATKIALDGFGFTINIYTAKKLNAESNLALARVLYHNYSGRLAGGISGPRFRASLPIGNLGPKDFSNFAKQEYIEKPISELRYNGVIYGFEIENVSIDVNDFYVLDIRRGVAYVNGKRIEKETVTSITSDIAATSIDKIYVIIDEDGNFKIDSALGYNCTTPYAETDFCILGSIEYDGINVDAFDLRLFIDHLDLKLLNSITVSPQPGMAHFADPVKALKYAKRFNEQFPLAGTPIVHMKSGEHKITLNYSYSENSTTWNPNTLSNLQIFYDQQIISGLFIDFPVVIEGEGPSTIIELLNNSEFLDTTYQITMPISIAGPGFAAATRSFSNIGTDKYVEIKNLTLKNTRIDCLDFNVETSGTEEIYNVKISNVYFSFYNFPGTFIDGTNGPRAIQLLETSDITENKGNLTIDGCTFVACGIHSGVVNRNKNLNITNNIFIDPDNVTNFLLTDIYSFTSATSGFNINIVNNRYNSGFNPNDGTGPEIVAGNTFRWGERFSRDIRVGNNGYFEGSTEVVNNYNYQSVKTKYEMYYIDDLFWLPSSLATGTYHWANTVAKTITFNMSSSTAAGQTVNYPYAEITSNGGRFKIGPRKGGELVGLQLGYRNVSAGTTVTVRIYQLNKLGGNTTLGFPPITLLATNSWTQSGAITTYHIYSESLTYNINLTSSDHYIIDIQHDDAINSLHFYWVKLELEIPSAEEGIGLE